MRAMEKHKREMQRQSCKNRPRKRSEDKEKGEPLLRGRMWQGRDGKLLQGMGAEMRTEKRDARGSEWGGCVPVRETQGEGRVGETEKQIESQRDGGKRDGEGESQLGGEAERQTESQRDRETEGETERPGEGERESDRKGGRERWRDGRG